MKKELQDLQVKLQEIIGKVQNAPVDEGDEDAAEQEAVFEEVKSYLDEANEGIENAINTLPDDE